MRLNAVKVLGISITNAPKNEILEEIRKYLTRKAIIGQKSLKIFTPNTEQLVFAHKNPDFTSVLNKADITLPDGIGVVWASTILTKHRVEKSIPGVVFMEDLAATATGCHVPIGLIGGRDNLAVDTLNCLRKKYNLLQDSWALDGPDVIFQNSVLKIQNENEKIYFDRLARRIVREGTRIVFVALGPPKQEYFITMLAPLLSGVILMSVGGSFDILSGRLRRAPVWMRSIGLEWLWRLILEPWRIRRQFALVEFVWLVCKERWLSRPA